MKPEDVDGGLMRLGRDALVRHERDVRLPYLPTYEERVRAVLAAVLPEHERQLLAERDAILRHDKEAVQQLNAAEAELDATQKQRDVLIDEVKTLQEDLEEFGEAQKTWVQFRRERDALKAELAETRAAIERVLNVAADKLDVLPPGGALLSGPYWYREGVRAAASLLRNWANHPAALDAPQRPEDTREETGS